MKEVLSLSLIDDLGPEKSSMALNFSAKRNKYDFLIRSSRVEGPYHTTVMP